MRAKQHLQINQTMVESQWHHQYLRAYLIQKLMYPAAQRNTWVRALLCVHPDTIGVNQNTADRINLGWAERCVLGELFPSTILLRFLQ